MATPEEFFKPNEQLLENLAKAVRQYRLDNGLTQKQLADRCGFHYKFIQTLETKKRNISISAFVQLTEGMEITSHLLLKQIDIKSTLN